ncbi:hypothetical protein EC973_006968 [Apophysomyces ossiformis]|uniref:Fungal lipase-type domain-containing protein n=1 Tax=Apophysomyces ossiformis TaxID=679940 RepID=A0A8H7BUH8_9FUNG|nr:hypothetical protein EC973_006968 [Apophysomyces ossiformis]
MFTSPTGSENGKHEGYSSNSQQGEPPSGWPIYQKDAQRSAPNFAIATAPSVKEMAQEYSESDRWNYMTYGLNVCKDLLLTFYYKPSMILTSPFSIISLVAIYAILFFAVLVISNVLEIYWQIRGEQQYERSMYSLRDKVEPSMVLDRESAKLVRATIPTMADAAPMDNLSDDNPSPSIRQRVFDLSIAQALLLLSTLIYQRDGVKVRSAVKLLSAKDEATRRKSIGKLQESLTKIREIADKWGLDFHGATELFSVTGPFCGVYLSKTDPVMVVCFKGTNIDSFEDILVDATLQRVEAGPYVFGQTHQGFYESLFSNSGFSKNEIHDPYHNILRKLNRYATLLRRKLGTDKKIQVWVTGHSLGGAMSTLLYARLLKCPGDLENCEIRDCYLYGTPAVGNNEFACTFSSYELNPLRRSSTLWRVINKKDLVSKLPLAKTDRTIGKYIGKDDIFNYFHVGHSIKLGCSDKQPIREEESVYRPTTEVLVQLGGWKPQKGPAAQASQKPQSLKESFFKQLYAIIHYLAPFSLVDHAPEGYRYELNRARDYCTSLMDKKQGTNVVKLS